MSIRVIQQYITKNQSYINNVNRVDSRYTSFQKTGARGIVLHSVGAAQPSAKVFADYFNNPNLEASVHAVLQADGTVYQLAPWNYRMWHVGGSANDTHLGIEMTEPDSIRYDVQNGYRLVILDKAKALSHVTATYQAAVELFAGLCQQLNLDPLADGVIISHAEAYKRGWGSGHTDPEHLWNALDCGYTMSTFRNDVANRLKEVTDMTVEEVKSLALNEGRYAANEAITKLMEGTGTGDNPSGWAEEATKWAKETGLIAGLGNGDYAWQAPMTRQEMVALLYRFSKTLEK